MLISGGDPLMLPDAQLEWILARVRAIGHVEMIRIGTRTPVVLPRRITAQPRGWRTAASRWATRACCCATSTTVR